jgi:hypothetical protein
MEKQATKKFNLEFKTHNATMTKEQSNSSKHHDRLNPQGNRGKK